MGNHYHLLVETPDSNLSRGMRYLNGVYTQRFNRTHSHVGHLFQGRFKAILVEKEAHMLELARYVVLNPVRAGMVESAEQWSWSSYPAMVGLSGCPEWFDREWLLGNFGESNRSAVRQYMRFVEDGVLQSSPWSMLKNQIYLGSDRFVEKVQSDLPSRQQKLSEIPKAQKRSMPKSIEEYLTMTSSRDEAIVAAYKSGGYTLQDIGSHFGKHYSTISRIIHRSMQE